jgi:hypothetical protein
MNEHSHRKYECTEERQMPESGSVDFRAQEQAFQEGSNPDETQFNIESQ